MDFAPSSYALGISSDCWYAYMDRFLTEGVDDDEKESVVWNMIQLVDLYYAALDGHKVNSNLTLLFLALFLPIKQVQVRHSLKVKAYPHFMEKEKFEPYHSISILGRIYDETKKAALQQSENDQILSAVRSICIQLAAVKSVGQLVVAWCPGQARHVLELLYGAEDFEETPRDYSEVFMEACTIYRIVYEQARSTKSIRKCCFVWNVAGAALCHLHAMKYAVQHGVKTALCPLSVIRQLY
ncbi:hypothetical protein U9M48_030925 [Paspalum notatum var. saurae]|uniref:RNA-dependent RNA polymerase n=1 Tax=Paspalum notatum var. saurae TaxID=547442 RepID=A0AAQ3X3T2_PASNO